MSANGVRSPISVRSLHEFSVKLLMGEIINLNRFAGKVVLIENVACMCGNTSREYAQMNELHYKYGNKFVVLAFPCNQFGEEPGNGEEILNSLKYVRPGRGFTPDFYMVDKTDVNGKNTHPIFQFLRDTLPFPSDDPVSFMDDPKKITWDPVSRSDVAWNFEKFLIAPNGRPYKRYSHKFQTASIQKDIKDLIQKFNL